jgi:hypothetical protein
MNAWIDCLTSADEADDGMIAPELVAADHHRRWRVERIPLRNLEVTIAKGRLRRG